MLFIVPTGMAVGIGMPESTTGAKLVMVTVDELLRLPAGSVPLAVRTVVETPLGGVYSKSYGGGVVDATGWAFGKRATFAPGERSGAATETRTATPAPP